MAKAIWTAGQPYGVFFPKLQSQSSPRPLHSISVPTPPQTHTHTRTPLPVLQLINIWSYGVPFPLKNETAVDNLFS